MQPPGRVHDDHVDAALDALVDRVERDARRVGALAVGPDHLGADPLAPGLQLVRGRGAERVGRAEQHGAPVADQHPGQLAAHGGLPGPVDAHHEHHRRPVAVPLDVQGPVHVRADLGQQLSFSIVLTSSGSRVPATLTSVRRSSTSCRAGATPMSAVISVSSISSQVSSSRCSRESRPSRTPPERGLRPGQPAAQPDQPPRRRRRLLRLAGGRGAGRGPRRRRRPPWTLRCPARPRRSRSAGASAVATPPAAGPESRYGPAGSRSGGGTAGTPRCRPPPATTTTAATMMMTCSITAQSRRREAMPAHRPAHPGWATRSDVPAGPLQRPGTSTVQRRAVRRSRLPQPLADHRGHAVAAHADPVQGVRHLHGPLLVGDDDQLGGVPELAEDLQQPPQVGVVERGLDLVQDVERGRPGPEDRHYERDRGQRALPAGQQRQPLDLLARRPGLDLDPGDQQVVGLGKDQPALAAGEQPARRCPRTPWRCPRRRRRTPAAPGRRPP